MMKIYSILLCCLLFSSCHNDNPSNEKIAQNKVRNYLVDTQRKNDYESIGFGKLDSAFTSVDDTELYKEYNQQRSAFEALEILRQQYPDLCSEEESIWNINKEKYYRAICDSLRSAFIPEFTGWKIQHIYKYKNDRNEYVVDNHLFFLNESIDSIRKDNQIYTNLPFKTYTQDTIFYGIKNNY